MRPYLLVLLVSAAVSYLMTLVLRRVCHRFHLLDYPDERKIHKEPVPYLGGVAVFLATLLGVVVALHLDRPFRYEFLQPFVGLFVASSIVFFLGIFDDLGGSTAGVKLTFQCVAGTVLWAYGFRIDAITAPWGTLVLDPLVGWMVTVFWFAALTNAMNLTDGLDGLAAGIGAIAATTLTIVGLLRGEDVLPFLGIALAGSLVGFLPHNLHPARIFLGDTGAMTIGFLLAAFGLVSYSKAATITTLAVPVAVLAIPVADTVLAMIRRGLRHEHLFRADRDHIHHRLLRLFPHARAVAILHLVTLYFALLGLGYVVLPNILASLSLDVAAAPFALGLTILLVGSVFLVVFALTLIEARRPAPPPSA